MSQKESKIRRYYTFKTFLPHTCIDLNISSTSDTGMVSMEFARLVSNELVIGEGRGPGVRSGCDSGLVGTSGQSYRQRGRLVVLTRMVYRPPGADPCQLPDLLRRRIRTEASEGRSLGWVVAVVVTELVLLLSLGV